MLVVPDQATASVLAAFFALWPYATKVAPPIAIWIADKLLAPALVAVVFSGLTNFYIDRVKADREQTTKLTDGLRSDLAVLQQLASEYWGGGFKKSDILVEAKILALQTDVIDTISLLSDTYSIDIADEEGLADLIDVVTGGDFGSGTRKADPERSGKCLKLISSMRSRIQAERLRRLRKTGQ